MKRSLLRLAAATLLVMTFAAGCEKDEHNRGEFLISYGEIADGSPGYSIRLDNGVILEIVRNHIPYASVKVGQRIIADYKIAGGRVQVNDSTAKYPVELNDLYNVLSKPALYSGNINTPAQQDSIGNDRSEVVDAWISSKYFNINFNIFRNNPNITHMVNLVVDEENSTPEKIYLKFRHNSRGDAPFYRMFGRVSFDISPILSKLEKGKQVKFILSWDGLHNNTPTREIRFTRK